MTNNSFYTEYSNKVGVLDINEPQTCKGKKFDEWVFHVRDGNKKKKPTEETKVSVIMHVIDDMITFKAHCSLFMEPMVDTDINALRKNVESYLIDQVSILSGIAWEDWFEVVVKGTVSSSENANCAAFGANLSICVNTLKRGIHPIENKPITIFRNGAVVDFPEPTSLHDTDNSKDSESGLRLFRYPEEKSYIPATEENRLALNSIINRMGMLRDNLADILCQDLIQGKLQSIESVLKLQAPQE